MKISEKKSFGLLGTRIDNFSSVEIMKKIHFFLSDNHFHQIATINPEFVLEAQKNSTFKKILNQCDLNVADGWGIKLAFARFGKKLRTRIPGTDLMRKVLNEAEKKDLSVFLATRKDGLSHWRETQNALLKIYPKLEIAGDDIDPKNVKYRLPNTKCQVLLCNFGAPDQEIFINSQKNATIRLAMGVGGSFDFLTGKAKRAPKFLRQIGMEWFWRMFQPQKWSFKKERIKRIFKSVIIFPIKIIFNLI
ncbi:MAG: hypothetical protein COT31_02945 [Candidatus Moranbacteria bacterium CG08_land_8_20_14_0_20_34_16]|nr:MAG: hypothetical protein COT31_02945 [Candidatus Moranbacteria bacterium CG08_land_8_20_14_0_20_34_16]